MALEENLKQAPLVRLWILAAIIAGVITSFGFPAVAQDGTGAVPENAHAQRYGGGWDCDLGYRIDDTNCVAIEVPENAHPTGRSYGAGWECGRGYKEVDNASCAEIHVPVNAFLLASGYGWQCERGFVADSGRCLGVNVPD